MKKYTKIVATISDKNCDVDFIASLARAGMNVVRANTAHLTAEGIELLARNTHRASDDLALMLDTKGPEIRTTATPDSQPLEIAQGERVEIVGDESKPTVRGHIYVNYRNIASDVKPGDRLLIDDGELAFAVRQVSHGIITAVAENSGSLGSRKTVNIPGVSLRLKAVTDRDRDNIILASTLGYDFIAHSFVRSADDVRAVQEILDSRGSDMKIISKIENQQGIDNFDEILRESYGIMVARGDLGIEVAAELIPGIQAMMVSKCIEAHKPVIVATQMLHSMIEHPRPTRAEVSDVAAAVTQRADAVMLSGETAKGMYPLESVQTMARIARATENAPGGAVEVPPLPDRQVTSFLTRQAVLSEMRVGTKAIITDAYRGRTARYIASFRGPNPTIAICRNLHVKHILALSYGVTPLYFPPTPDEGRHPVRALRRLLDEGIVGRHDLVAYLGGTDAGATSLEIDTADALCR